MKNRKIALLVVLTLILSLAVVPLLSGCSNDIRVLKVYNAEDYINPEILDEFVQYYQQKTGEKIKIQYDCFDTLERAYTIINNRKADYDVVCPSDYIIEKMKKNNLLAELDHSKIPNLDNIPPFLLDRNFDKGNRFSVPYMWGTVGIMYNVDKVSPEDVNGWDLLWNKKYKNKILMKDSIRDSVFIATIYAYRDELEQIAINNPEEYTATIDRLVNNITEETMAKVERELREQYHILYAYEVDSGKDSMINGEAYINLAWSGDAVWAVEEAASHPKNPINLDYYIPDEGSNIWFDNWVIPVYGKNPDIAHEFINFLCDPDIALKNMDECGYTSAVISPEILEYMIDDEAEPADFSYLFEGDVAMLEEYKNKYGLDLTSLQISEISMPPAEKAANLVEMTDFGDRQDMVVKMWTRVKALPLGLEVKIFSICLAIFIIGLISFSIYKSISKKRQLAGKAQTENPINAAAEEGKLKRRITICCHKLRSLLPCKSTQNNPTEGGSEQQTIKAETEILPPDDNNNFKQADTAENGVQTDEIKQADTAEKNVQTDEVKQADKTSGTTNKDY